MKCDKCQGNYNEKLLEESHDYPKYLFKGTNAQKKSQADKLGRHWLCIQCHDKYERTILARIYCFVYKQIIHFPHSRKDLSKYMLRINAETNKLKIAKIWNIITDIKEEFYNEI